MLRKFTKSFIFITVILLILVGCSDSTGEKRQSVEFGTLKEEMDVSKDSIGKNEQMQVEIDNLKKEIVQLKARMNVNLEASVYSCSINEANIEVTIDFKKEDDVDRDINFIVLSGNTKNQCISGDYNVIRYDEVIIPGKGTLGTDDVPKDVKRYRIVFPSRSYYVYHIIAIDKKTGSLWNYEINSSMQGDI